MQTRGKNLSVVGEQSELARFGAANSSSEANDVSTAHRLSEGQELLLSAVFNVSEIQLNLHFVST